MNPIPPWERAAVSPNVQTLFGDGAIGLNFDVTYLDATTDKDANDPSVAYEVTLPDGNRLREVHRIYATNEATAKFRVSGAFMGFTSLLFDSIGHGAVVEWVGNCWQLIGGNAKPEP